MSENIAATLRNLVYNGADEATMHKAMLEAAGALDDMVAEYEKMNTMHGEFSFKMWEWLMDALYDMKHITNTHMLCDCCKCLNDDGTCSNPRDETDHCWVWRGMGEVLKSES